MMLLFVTQMALVMTSVISQGKRIKNSIFAVRNSTLL